MKTNSYIVSSNGKKNRHHFKSNLRKACGVMLQPLVNPFVWRGDDDSDDENDNNDDDNETNAQPHPSRHKLRAKAKKIL